MKTKVVLPATALGLTALGLLAGLYVRPAHAADPGGPAAPPGRYQVSHGSGDRTYLLDTATGRLWVLGNVQKGGEWYEWCEPPKPR